MLHFLPHVQPVVYRLTPVETLDGNRTQPAFPTAAAALPTSENGTPETGRQELHQFGCGASAFRWEKDVLSSILSRCSEHEENHHRGSVVFFLPNNMKHENKFANHLLLNKYSPPANSAHSFTATIQ